MEELALSLVERYPDSAVAWKVLGTSLYMQGKDALPAWKKVVDLLPDVADGHNNLGISLQNHGQLDAAMASYRRAIEIKPDYSDAHYNLGNALRDLGQFNNAVLSYRRALEIKPDYADSHNNLGNVLRDIGQLNDAVTHYRRALAIKPDYVDAYSNLLFCLSQSEMDAQKLFAEHCKFGMQFEDKLRAGWLPHATSQDPQRCLQVGLVSGDLQNHAVANFIEPVLIHLADYAQLQLHAYSNSAVEDNTSQRLRGYFKHWNPIALLSDESLAEKIRADRIDILIDLSGHTGKHRLLTFARKPAPIQASWMGYPGTTGLTAMDYYLSDRFLLPHGEFDNQFTERIVHLPASAPFLPRSDAPPVNTLPALINGFITFGSFNHPGKITQATIALWAQLLHQMPNSRLLLGGMSKDSKCSMLIEWFTQRGITQDRLSIHDRCGMGAYLSLHHQVDICLDTFPYNGGTTTLHALWMGVPTLTLAGNTVAGRPGACILGHVGLDSFISYDAEDFVQKGLLLASNLAELSNTRSVLRARFANSAMGQPAVVAAGVERALRIMWQRWCAGLPPESFDVNLSGSKQPDPATQLIIEQTLQQAITDYQSGRHQAAEALYCGILQLQPDHPEANHNLGVLTAQKNQPADALPYFLAALDAAPAHGQYWLSYIDALFQAGQANEAQQVLELARQQGLQGNAVDLLALRLKSEA